MTKKDLQNKNIAILGFGTEGRDVFEYLKSVKCNISIRDIKEKKDLDLVGIDTKNIHLGLGNKYLKFLDQYDIVFRSPGVYRYFPDIISAEKKGVVITSAIKYFLQNCPAITIGVTGTKGKGTTSTLIYEILRQAQDKSIKKVKKDIYLLGNIGISPLQVLPKLNNNSTVVLELSSFQLIDLEGSPNISVVLNISSDHMDWHKDDGQYIDAKRNIVKFQKSGDFAVINADYPKSMSFKDFGEGKKYFFSLQEGVNGVYIAGGNLYSNINEKVKKIGSSDKLILRGSHNQENVCAAACASILAGASIKNIQKSIYSFKGLEHRLEFVRNVNGVKYYNDSFSTNPQTVEAAVKSFDEPMTLILGGFDKKLNYQKIFKMISSMINIVNIILIGDMGKTFHKLLIDNNFSGKIIDMEYASMKEIVEIAFRSTPEGGVVILSPGCSSFDMFRDYKERGKLFKEEVNRL